MTGKKISHFVFLLIVVFFISGALFAQTTRDSRILSPCPGTWANMQSLVVQADPGCDVFYSVTEANPLVLGIAYDGPVLLEQTGICSVAVSIVEPDGTSTTSIISYSVKPETTPVPAFRNTNPVHTVARGDSLYIPSDLYWSVSSHTFSGITDSSLDMQRGGKIMLEDGTSSEYFAQVILKSEKSLFRYILSVAADTEKVVYEAPEPAVADIEFSQWNWIRFYQGEAVLYSIDDEPLRQTTKPVYIDRTEPHVIRWKLVNPVTSSTVGNEPDQGHSLYLPPKPVLAGLPARGFVQKGVSVTTDDTDYILCYTDSNGNACYSNVWYADVLTGDSRGFSETFTLYYRGIKQGTINGSFIIDKAAPAKPILTSNTSGNFSRSAVVLQVTSDETVYVKVSAVERSVNGFSLSEYYDLLPVLADLQNDEEALVALTGSSPDASSLMRCGYYKNDEQAVVLDAVTDGAVLYLVSAIARDAAGNISGLSFSHAIIDANNYYVQSAVSTPASEVPAGFKDNPYTRLQDAIAASSGVNLPKVFIQDFITCSEDILLNHDCVISGSGSNTSGIRLTRDNRITVIHAKVSFDSLRFEKRLSNRNYTVTQSNLLMIQQGTVSMNHCDLLANLGDNGTAVMATDSTLDVRDSLVSIQTSSYGCAFSCETTDFNLFDTQLFVTAKTCSGITQFRNACRLQNCQLQLSGSLVQAVSLSDAYGDFSDCIFTDTTASGSSWALWTGGDSAFGFSGTKAVGFKALIAE